MITYLKMDLFQSPAHVLVNTVNTVGVMGKGIAKTFKDIYPDMFTEYQKLCENNLLTVGKLWVYKTPNKWILNFPTKQHWRSPSKIEYIEEGLKKFVQHYEEKGIDSIAFPPLGCGNGGLNWESEVKPLMERYLKDLPIEVYVHLPPEEMKHKKKEHQNIQEIKKWLWSQPTELSFFEVWEDIVNKIDQQLTLYANEVPYDISLINENNENAIRFKTEKSITNISKNQLNDAWDTLRNIGVITRKTIPDHLKDVSNLTFNLLNLLPYIEPIEVAHTSKSNQEGFEVGIRLVPVLEDINHQGELMI